STELPEEFTGQQKIVRIGGIVLLVKNISLRYGMRAGRGSELVNLKPGFPGFFVIHIIGTNGSFFILVFHINDDHIIAPGPDGYASLKPEINRIDRIVLVIKFPFQVISPVVRKPGTVSGERVAEGLSVVKRSEKSSL